MVVFFEEGKTVAFKIILWNLCTFTLPLKITVFKKMLKYINDLYAFQTKVVKLAGVSLEIIFI